MTFDVIVDTREQQPWVFKRDRYIQNSIRQKLDTGDYCIDGLQHGILCLERKKSVAEFANNITKKSFKACVDRMEEFEYSFLIFEFDINNILEYPKNSGIPPKYWRRLKVRGRFMMQEITKIQLRGIQVVFAGNTDNAKYIATNIMKDLYEQYISSELAGEPS